MVAFLFCNPDGVPERRWVGGWGRLCSAIVSLAGPFSPYDSLLGSICCHPRSLSRLPSLSRLQSEITWANFNKTLVVRDRRVEDLVAKGADAGDLQRLVRRHEGV